jgi:hypothetical protein
MTHRTGKSRRVPAAKPYAMVGAGQLASAIWKTGDEVAGWRYQFNLFRMSPKGRIGQQFGPADLVPLVKLVRVLAAVLADDGCVSPTQQTELARLAVLLDEFTAEDE